MSDFRHPTRIAVYSGNTVFYPREISELDGKLYITDEDGTSRVLINFTTTIQDEDGVSIDTVSPLATKTIKIPNATESKRGMVKLGTATPKVASGSGTRGTSAAVAHEDHVHPVQTTISGNAGSATKLETARTITIAGDANGSVSFDGTKDVSITIEIIDDSHNHSMSTLTGILPISKGGTGASTAAGILTNAGLTATAAELNVLDGVTITVTELNCLDNVKSNVQAQLDGKAPTNHASTGTEYGVATASNYGHAKASSTTPKAPGTATVGTETGSYARGDHVHPVQTTISGNAGTASKLAAAKKITLSGDATGNVDFDGSKDVTLTVTVNDDSHNHVISNVDGLKDELDSKVPLTQKGAANGVAELDASGKVPSSQLPSFVDDVIEGYLNNGKFYKESSHTTEITGESGKIYTDLSTNKTYRWSGSAYTEISASLALGETSSTAYRGDRGKTAYDHSQKKGGATVSDTNPHGLTPANIGASPSSHTHNYAGSSSAGGAANSANKLNTDAGSTTEPVYFANGIPVKTTLNAMINALGEGSSTPTDNDFYISQYVGGGTTTTTYHRRPVSALWSYIKGKADSVYAPIHSHPYAGSATQGGSATSAVKLDTATAGDNNKPVYFSGGKPVAVDHKLEADVPADAKFTDTTYTASNGVTLTGTNFTNSGVRSIATGGANGTISVNTNGTAVDVPVKGLGTAAYQADTYFAKASHGTHVTYGSEAPKAPGTAAAGSAASVSRSDHVHPAQTSVTGNAGTATKLANKRTITLEGDVTGSVEFDGSANAVITTTISGSSESKKVLEVILNPTTHYSAGTVTPYVYNIPAADVLATDNPMIDLVVSDDYDTAQDELYEYAKIYSIETSNGSIKVSATEPISTEMTLTLKLVCIISPKAVEHYMVDVPTTGWTGSDAPYSRTVTVNGLVADDTPIVDLVLPAGYSEAQDCLGEFNKVYKIDVAANQITLYATSIPTISVTMKMMCIR